MLKLSDDLYLDPTRIDAIVVHPDGASVAYPRNTNAACRPWHLDREQTRRLLDWFDARGDDGIITDAALEAAVEQAFALDEPALPHPKNMEPLGSYLGRVIDALNDAGLPNAAWLAARIEVLRRDAPERVVWAPTGDVMIVESNGRIVSTVA